MNTTNFETLTPRQEENIAELGNMLKLAFAELTEENWCEGEAELENVCYLRYYIDGCGIYISQHGNIFYDDTLPIENFSLNSIEETSALKPETEMPAHISDHLSQLKKLNRRYADCLFTVVASDNGNIITVSSESHSEAYWQLRLDTFENLTAEMINALENEKPNSSLKEPVPGI